MRKTCLNAVHELARRDPRVVFVGSDLGAGTLQAFREEFPDRFFMEGISEQAVLGLAAGLAMEGFIPYVNTIATFLTRRAYEQAAVDICLHNAPVRLIGSGGGLVYAPLGPTHMAVEDIALMRLLPNMTILCPADAAEMAALMPLTVDHPGPIYIRLAKGFDPLVTRPDLPWAIGRGMVYARGGEALLVTTGIGLRLCLEAAEQLTAQGVGVSLLHLPTVKPLDTAALLELAATARAVVTVEEHTILGGLGGAVAEVMAEADFPTVKRFARLGLPDQFPSCYGSQAQQLALYGLDAPGIAAKVLELLGRA